MTVFLLKINQSKKMISRQFKMLNLERMVYLEKKIREDNPKNKFLLKL